VRRSFAFKITMLILGWLLLAIACEQVPARVFWPVVFGALTTPLALVATALVALYWLRRNWRVALLPIVALVLTWPHVQRGLALHTSLREELRTEGRRKPIMNEELGTKAIPPSSFLIPHSSSVALLSANVRIFNVYAQLRDPDFASSKGSIRWLAASPADVLCLQEYYNEPGGSKEDGNVFRTEEYLGRGSGRHAFVSSSLTNGIGAEFGMAIFSRFAIVRRGTIPFGRLSQNHAMWADLVRPAARTGRGHPDTIRVFNVHLQSMSMADADIATATESRAGLRAKAPNLLRRFRNDLPYSYVYDQLADHLQNAWATVGLGIGATYNGRLPGLRIDQQFAGPQWQVLGCRVHSEIKWSDHFPLEGLYQLSK